MKKVFFILFISFISFSAKSQIYTGSKGDGFAYQAISSIEVSTTEKMQLISRIYPNPCNNSADAFIKLRDYQERINLSLIDIHGKEILNQDYFNTNELSLEMPDKPGIYLVKISTGNKTFCKRITVI